MLVGANAGASLAVGEHSWGPGPSTQVPIWYTTLVDICAGAKKTAVVAAVTSAAVVGRDEGMTTTVTVVTKTATVCLSTGLVECPASLQSAVKNVVTTTLTAAVPVGTAEAAFTTTAGDAVVRTKAFGAGAKQIGATSGSPVSYIPTISSTTTSKPTSSGPASTGTDSSIIEGKTKGVSNKVIIGVSVGVGVPVLILIIAGCL